MRQIKAAETATVGGASELAGVKGGGGGGGALVVARDGLVGVDGEGLPHDDFADVGGDEEGEAAAETVALGVTCDV